MSDEELVPAVVTAPEQEATAAPESEVTQPEVVAEKTFTQDELNEIIGKRLAKERSKWERSQQAPPPPAPPLPPVADFASEEDYQKAVIEQYEATKRAEEANKRYRARAEEISEKYEDFEQVAHSHTHPVSEVMAEAIRASDVGPDIAYYLGLNPAESVRIFQLPPLLQAKEIGRLEAKVAAEPPTRKVTNAPEPIRPGRTQTSTAPVLDTTDPRSVKSMSTSEWIEAERRRELKAKGLI